MEKSLYVKTVRPIPENKFTEALVGNEYIRPDAYYCPTIRSYRRLEEMIESQAPESLISSEKKLLLRSLGNYFKTWQDSKSYDEILTIVDADSEEVDRITGIDDQQLKVIRSHDKVIRLADQELLSFAEIYNSHFKESVTRLSKQDRQLIPINYQERFSTSLTVKSSDPIFNADMMNINGAFYLADSRTILIDPFIVIGLDNSIDLKKAYYHQLLHAYSGKLILEATLSSSLEELLETNGQLGDFSAYAVTQIGLQDRGNSVSTYLVDDGYTEWASLRLMSIGYDQEELWSKFLNVIDVELENIDFADEHLLDRLLIVHNFKQYSSNYLAERIILAGLISHGVPLSLLGRVYFEHYSDTPEKRSTTVSYRQNLDKVIDQQTKYSSLTELEIKIITEAKDMTTNNDNIGFTAAYLLAKSFDECR